MSKERVQRYWLLEDVSEQAFVATHWEFDRHPMLGRMVVTLASVTSVHHVPRRELACHLFGQRHLQVEIFNYSDAPANVIQRNDMRAEQIVMNLFYQRWRAV